MRPALTALFMSSALLSGANAADLPARAAPVVAPPVPPAAAGQARDAGAYLREVLGMIEEGFKSRCGTDIIGQMVLSAPALAASGDIGQRNANEATLQKAFRKIDKMGDASSLPQTSSSLACRNLAERFEKLSSEQRFVNLVGVGLMQMLQDAKVDPPRN